MKCNMNDCVASYSRLVVRRPLTVLLSCVFFCLILVGGAIGRGVLPDFKSAGKGFEARGNALSGRLYAVDRGLEMAQCAGELSALPGTPTYHTFGNFPENDPLPSCAAPTPGTDSCKKARDGKCNEIAERTASDDEFCALNTDHSDCNGIPLSPTPSPPPMSGRRLSSATGTADMCYKQKWQLDKAWGVQLVFEPKDGSTDLLSADSLKAMCSLADRVASDLGDVCEERHYSTGGCCAARSLGSYAALLAGKPSCADLTQADADSFKSLLNTCAPQMSAGTLKYEEFPTWQDTSVPPPPSAPPGSVDCSQYNAVFDAYNALIDIDFLDTKKAAYVKLMLPHNDLVAMKDLHIGFLKGKNQEEIGGGAVLTAYELNNGELKMELFSELLGLDGIYIGCGFGVVFIVMWLYTGSYCVTSLCFAQVPCLYAPQPLWAVA